MSIVKTPLFSIGRSEPVFFIAEIGLNHNGDVELGKDMIDAAESSGASAVKFQTYRTEEFIAQRSDYFDIFKRSELTPDRFSELHEHSKKIGITFFSTPFDFESVDLLATLKVPMFKVASCDLTNRPLIARIAKQQRPIILSAGLGTLGELISAIEWCYESGNRDVIVLHCIAHYPTDPRDVNLRTIPFLRRTIDHPIGLSDHTLGIDVPLASVALGAQVIEKHFTLDKTLPGPDHQLSTTPTELSELVQRARVVSTALGEEHKDPPESDDDRRAIRRSLTVRSDIPSGTVLKESDISIKRPGDGLPPMFYEYILGRKTKVDLKCDDQFRSSDLD